MNITLFLNYYLFILLLISWELSMGQHTISDKILPAEGDTIYFVSTPDRIPEHMMDKNSAGVWDYNILNVPFVGIEEYRSAHKGSHASKFETADLVLKKLNGEEQYFKIEKGALYMLGEILSSSANKKSYFVVKFSKPKLMVKTPLKINQIDKREELISIVAKRSNLTENWQKYFPSEIDSISWEIHRKIECEAKDAGYLTINGEGHQVQLSESKVQSSYKIKIKYKGTKSWINFPLESFKWPVELKNLWFSNDYIERIFYSENFKGPLLSYRISGDGSQSDIAFQIKDLSKDVPYFQLEKSAIISFPNPSFGTVYFSLVNYPPDFYKLEVYNIIGKVLYRQTLTDGINNRYRVDLGHLRKGTYMYSILDNKGNKLTTKRFVLVTP